MLKVTATDSRAVVLFFLEASERDVSVVVMVSYLYAIHQK